MNVEQLQAENALLKSENAQMKSDLKHIKKFLTNVFVGVGMLDDNGNKQEVSKLRIAKKVGSLIMSEEKQDELGFKTIMPFVEELEERYKNL